MAFGTAAILVAMACGSPHGDTALHLDKIAPSCGSSAGNVPVTITGEMPVKAVVSLSDPNASTLETAYRAWLGDVELDNVARVDDRTLTAVVPSMDPDRYSLTVRGPTGDPVTKDGAFVVTDGSCSGGATAAAIDVSDASADPASATLGGAITVSATVENSGTADALSVKPSIAAAPSALSAPPAGPAPQDIPAGDSRTFDWTYSARAAGGGTFSIEAEGTAADTKETIKADAVATNAVVVNTPSFLTSIATATPEGASVGQSITVVLTVTNHASAGASVTPSIDASGPATLMKSPSPATVPGGGQQAFVWTYRASAAGNVTFATSASGIDPGTGKPSISSAPEVTVAIGSRGYSVGGRVSGLIGSGLVLQLNAGGPTLSVLPESKSYAFPFIPSNTHYDVEVAVQPTEPDESCAAANRRGTVHEANISRVAVRCVVGLGLTIRGQGEVLCDGRTCAKSYLGGAKVALWARPAVGSPFAGWTGDCAGPRVDCELTMAKARSVVATFSQP